LRHFLFALGLVCAIPALVDAAAMYDVFRVPPVRANIEQWGWGINDNAFVAGTSHDSAFVYNGVATTQHPNIGSGSIALAVNNNGTFVGYGSGNPGGPGGAWTYAGGTVTSLVPLIGAGSQAYGINSSGVIVGVNGSGVATRIDGTTVTTLGTLGGNTSAAFGINNAGQIVGNADYSPASSDVHAFLYSGGTMSDLTLLTGGSNGTAYDITNSGAVVGNYNSGGVTHGFLYSGGTVTDLGAFTRAQAINDAGVIVGVISNNQPAVYQGGSWTPLQTLIDPASGWELNAVTDINALGQIVGYGRTTENPLWTDAFILTPIPEPATISLLGLGAGIGSLVRGRRRR
jgi:probable HAF family extracellular repeat protein